MLAFRFSFLSFRGGRRIEWPFDFPSLFMWCPRFRMLRELRGNLIFHYFYEKLFRDNFKQTLIKSSFLLSRISMLENSEGCLSF